jgi:hypothetical protein
LDRTVGGLAVHQDDLGNLDRHPLEDVRQVVSLVEGGDDNTDPAGGLDRVGDHPELLVAVTAELLAIIEPELFAGIEPEHLPGPPSGLDLGVTSGYV